MAQKQVYMPNVRTVNFNSYNASMLTSNTKNTVTLQKGAIDSVKHALLKLTVVVSGSSVVLAPTPTWFQQIDLRSSSNNELIATMYDQTAMINLLQIIDSGRQKNLFKNSCTCSIKILASIVRVIIYRVLIYLCYIVCLIYDNRCFYIYVHRY